MHCKLTNCSNNLRLQTKLGLETSSKVADATLSITRHVWNLSDMVEHMSTCKEENSDQADGSPKIPVLDDRGEVWCGNGEEGDETENSGCNSHSLDIVEWSRHRGLLALRKVSSDPSVDRVGGLLSVFCEYWSKVHENYILPSGEVKTGRISIGLCVWSRGWVEDQQYGRMLELQLFIQSV